MIHQQPEFNDQVVIVFIHGFTDHAGTWKLVSDQLGNEYRRMAIVLEEVPDSENLNSAEVLEGFASQVVRQLEKDFPDDDALLVGHSMGGAVAELAAVRLGLRAKGLALLTPAPLKGFPLPAAVMQRFESLCSLKNVEMLEAGRKGMARNLDQTKLSLLVQGNLLTDESLARQQLRAWTGGHPAGNVASQVTCPVLMVATDDTFFDYALLAGVCLRFKNSWLTRISGAGHWVHVEQPEALASMLKAFMAGLKK